MKTAFENLTRRKYLLWQVSAAVVMLALTVTLVTSQGQKPAPEDAEPPERHVEAVSSPIQVVPTAIERAPQQPAPLQIAALATTTDTLRIRSGPGTGYSQMGLVPADTTLPVLGRNADGSWIVIEFHGMRGWIAGWLCTFAGDLAGVPVTDSVAGSAAGTAVAESSSSVPGSVTATTATELRLRSGPGTGYPQIGLVGSGVTMSVLGRDPSESWVLVERGGAQVWVAAWLCQINGNLNDVPVVSSYSQAPSVAAVPSPPAPDPASSVYASLADFWSGRADWVLQVPDTGLPVGESDTLYMGNNVYWAYLHASTRSAGIRDSCGNTVDFPGCVTRWVSTDGGRHFSLAEPRCIFKCNSCPCDDDDQTWQQQYPRVTWAPGRGYIMVYEHGAAAWISYSSDGVTWTRPRSIPGTGVWTLDVGACQPWMRIGPSPFFEHEKDCMAGGPPGLLVVGGRIYVFVGLGQNPGSMGCFSASLNEYRFTPCSANPLFDGAREYGPLEARGASANPYFDFRYATSADVVRIDGYYYMAYEGIRGPSSPATGRDDQFALAFARSSVVDGKWEKYPGNPVLSDVVDNWGIGHADILVVDGVTYMYTGTPGFTRGRYVLTFK